ncbi:MAG: D-alanine--D-alanine ligase [Fuerstiella sp.]|nr:D-alanine--D-alanine ligase [Fuerstiella sp.]MCP4854118.1 D-alanine--D-alanine ligase [Fuerstiella sp.]
MLNILVLAGGTSAERDISLKSGCCVADALRETEHHVDVVDPRDTAVESLQQGRWDIAVPMVHGTGGEDGVLQRQLLKAGIPYVGSSPDASELTFDKIRTNRLLRESNIVVPDGIVVDSRHSLQANCQAVSAFAGNVVTKPPRQGSSLGISIVQHAEQVEAALMLAFQFDTECLVERFIPGREVTVPVVDGTALPSIEIYPAVQWYDYQAKYADDRTEYRVSPEGLPNALPQIAATACNICGVAGIVRVDFRVDEQGQPWLLEVNTVPGMTTHSLVPKAAAAVGLSLGELCQQAIATRLTAPR